MALLLTESDVRSLLTMDLALEAVEAAFRGLAGGAVNHPRRRVPVPRGALQYMASALTGEGVMGLKIYPTVAGQARFLVPLFNSADGRLLALIEADWLGRMRTGAASGVAAKLLARPEARSLGLFGTGGQAETQLLALCAVRPLARVHLYSRSPEKRAAFARRMQPQVQAELIPVDEPRAAVEGMDIVTTITNAREPLFSGDWLSPGTHLNAAGSNHLQRRELDGRSVQRCSRITAASLEQARLESGDLAPAVEEGLIRWSDVAEFAEVLSGHLPGRTSPEEITLFVSLGISAWDIAAAARVYALARERGLGREISLLD